MKKTEKSISRKKILAVFAHPDDESFGPGGTLALYARQNTEIYLLCATSGQAGQNSKKIKAKPVRLIREKELVKATFILGIKKLKILNYLDGEISNHEIGYLTKDILSFINKIKPEIIITFDPAGHYGHLDHMGTSVATTFAFHKSPYPSKLYYHVLPKKNERIIKEKADRLFFFTDDRIVTTSIDITSTFKIKLAAIRSHLSQKKDWEMFIPILKKLPKKEYFYLAAARKTKVTLPEVDLMSGLG